MDNATTLARKIRAGELDDRLSELDADSRVTVQQAIRDRQRSGAVLGGGLVASLDAALGTPVVTTTPAPAFVFPVPAHAAFEIVTMPFTVKPYRDLPARNLPCRNPAIIPVGILPTPRAWIDALWSFSRVQRAREIRAREILSDPQVFIEWATGQLVEPLQNGLLFAGPSTAELQAAGGEYPYEWCRRFYYSGVEVFVRSSRSDVDTADVFQTPPRVTATPAAKRPFPWTPYGVQRLDDRLASNPLYPGPTPRPRKEDR